MIHDSGLCFQVFLKLLPQMSGFSLFNSRIASYLICKSAELKIEYAVRSLNERFSIFYFETYLTQFGMLQESEHTCSSVKNLSLYKFSINISLCMSVSNQIVLFTFSHLIDI